MAPALLVRTFYVSKISRCSYCCSVTNKNVANRKFSTSQTRSTLTLDNVFSAENRKQTIMRMQKAKPFFVRPDLEPNRSKNAAVLVPLCLVNGEPSLLFMIRSRFLKNHRGEISFPGGMYDEGDRDFIHTALRETFEEIGLPEQQVDIWGTIPPSPSKNGGLVTPVLGYCNLRIEELTLNHAEVEEVFTRTISSLCDPANQRQTQWRYRGTKGYTMPVFLGENHRIWGLTAVILHQVLQLVAPGLYTFRLQHRT